MIVFKLALAPSKFDLMKKSEIRENLKDLHPWIFTVTQNLKAESLLLATNCKLQYQDFYYNNYLSDT